jgi:hypothetical protein
VRQEASEQGFVQDLGHEIGAKDDAKGVVVAVGAQGGQRFVVRVLLHQLGVRSRDFRLNGWARATEQSVFDSEFKDLVFRVSLASVNQNIRP